MTFRLFSLINFSAEFFIMLWRFRHISNMRNAGFREYQKKTEEEKMRVHSKKVSTITVGSLILFFVLLSFGEVLIMGRTCDIEGGHVLTWGVCQKCEDPQCIDCQHGIDQCNACAIGYHGDRLTGKCMRCDSDLSTKNIKCSRCNKGDKEGEMHCIECINGYSLDPVTNQCMDCLKQTGVPGCSKCSSTTC